MRSRLLTVVIVLVILSLACNMPATTAATPTGSSQLITQVAKTLQAMNTPTLAATETGSELITPIPTWTTIPSRTPTAPIITPTATTQPCDQAQFIADVTVPDGTQMVPGQAFTKTWRLRNLGQCTWDERYSLVFVTGDALGAPAVVSLTGQVPMNATVDVSINMTAPASPGKYIGYWKLRNPAGEIFGVVADQPFFVQIKVVQVTPTVTPTPTSTAPVSSVMYDFTSNVCKAEWRSEAGGSALPCPGSSGDANGYVMVLQNPTLETGSIETSPVLLTVPKNAAQGLITGVYPAMDIASGYHFKATLGCLNGQAACSVTYQVNYMVAGAQVKNLGQWTQTYDGSIQGIDIDLSGLAGSKVSIILVVLAGDSANQDQAVWVYPRIVKQ